MKNTIHGDVDLIAINTLPKEAKKVDLQKTNAHARGTWIELGEHSGNAHVIAPTQGGIVNFYMLDNVLYTEVIDAPAIITHEEHAPLEIHVGIYKKAIEWEYDPFAEVIKQVQD